MFHYQGRVQDFSPGGGGDVGTKPIMEGYTDREDLEAFI